jgi:hypothetical protein
LANVLRIVLQAVIPLIVGSESKGDFNWAMPKQLSNREHLATADAAKKHLLNHPSSRNLTQEKLLDGLVIPHIHHALAAWRSLWRAKYSYVTPSF